MLIDRRGPSRYLRGFLLALGLLAFDCSSAREEPTGGETHFLSTCDAATAPCGGDLLCVCHVCTVPCSEPTTCGRFPAASCVSPSSNSCQMVSAKVCDVTCDAPEDCANVAGAPLCVAGVCRGADSAPAACPPSEVSANEVVILGDSFFAATHSITAFLEDSARQSGVISAGERYRDYSSPVDNTLALGGNGIEAQYTMASAEGPVKVVVMTGGGADLLLGSCTAISPTCPLLTNAAAAASTLFAHIASDGVANIVYVYYPDPADAKLSDEVDALRPLLASACQNSPVPCLWVDLRPAFAGNYGTYLDVTGTIPTPEGAQAAAAAIWSSMQQACVAQ